MSLIIPPIPPITFPSGPFSNVQPFTYRAGETFLGELNTLRHYLIDVVVPYTEKYLAELPVEFQGTVNELLTGVNALTDQLNGSNTDAELALVEMQELVASLPDLPGITETVTQAVTDTQTALAAAQLAATQVDSIVGAHNVLRYGAIGDGTVDDSAALQAAITASAADGKPVLIPEGVRIKSEITLTDVPVKITGPGTLVQDPGKTPLTINHTFGVAIPVTQGVKKFGPNNPPLAQDTSFLSTFKPGDNDYTRFAGGDVYHLTSQDQYAWAAQALSGGNVWKAAFVPIHGVGIEINLPNTANIAEGKTIVGMTSGATAVIEGVLTDGNSVAVTNKVNGNFAIGETVNVGGVASGVIVDVYVIANMLVEDTYTTQPQFRKVKTDIPVNLDIIIEANGNPDSFAGAATRATAVRLRGVYNAQIRAVVRGAWSRAIQYTSCYLGRADIDVYRLPNHAQDAEAAYGYGVELLAATEGIEIRATGRFLRHLVTTNVTGTTYGNNIYAHGTVKRCRVFDSVAYNSYAAGFDTHEGCYFVSFENCRSVNGLGFGRRFSGSAGFSNRGFGTRFIDCVTEGCTVGFSEGGTSLASDIDYVTVYDSCRAINYGQAGYFEAAQVHAANKGIVDIVNCDMRGDGRVQSQPYYQYGYDFRGGRTNLINCRASRFNGAPIRILGDGTARTYIENFTADYYDTPSSATGLRMQTTATEVVVAGSYNVRPNPGKTLPASVFRNFSGDSVWNIDAHISRGGGTADIFAVDAGAPVINIRDMVANIKTAERESTGVGKTLLARQSAPVQIWDTTFASGDRTCVLSATGAIEGDMFRIVRMASAVGAGNLVIGTTGKSLAAGQWCDVRRAAASWEVVAFGSL